MPIGARPSRILSATAKFLFFRAAARSSITSGITWANSSSPSAACGFAGGATKMPRTFASSLIVVSSSVERGHGRGVALAGAFQVGVVAVLVGDLGQLEQFADRAAGVEVVVHRGEELLDGRRSADFEHSRPRSLKRARRPCAGRRVQGVEIVAGDPRVALEEAVERFQTRCRLPRWPAR